MWQRERYQTVYLQIYFDKLIIRVVVAECRVSNVVSQNGSLGWPHLHSVENLRVAALGEEYACIGVCINVTAGQDSAPSQLRQWSQVHQPRIYRQTD